MNIGFFDSGIGGMVVLRSVVSELPKYNYVYFGDTKNLPYGEKTEDEIFELTKAGVERLFQNECQIVIVACNTASARVVRKLQDSWLLESYPDRCILGVIIPTIEAILEGNFKKIFIIGTKYTIDSRKYQHELESDTRKIESFAAAPLVDLIEKGEIIEAENFFKKKILPNIEKFSPDILVLGCTHFGLLKDEIRKILTCEVLSQDEIVGEKLLDYLKRHPEIEGKIEKDSKRTFLFSANYEKYQKIAGEWFQK